MVVTMLLYPHPTVFIGMTLINILMIKFLLIIKNLNN